ncbi:MAG: hypothetical protein ACKVP4_08895 [Hyphomicrobium sp.]
MVKHQHYWLFWIEDKGLNRLILVGEQEFHAAEAVALAKIFNGRTVSYQVLPHTVAEFVGLSDGECLELTPRSFQTPGGIERGGRDDAKGA